MIDHSDYIRNMLILYIIIIVIIFIIIKLLSDYIYKKFIPYIKQKKIGQIIRKEGMETHFIKEGTPTMGGIVFGIIFIVFGSLYTLYKIIRHQSSFEVKYIPILCLFVMALMFIGYKDDLMKITLKNTDGLSPNKKIILQIVSSIIFISLIIYLRKSESINTYISIPIFTQIVGKYALDYQNIIYILIYLLINVFILVGTQNGTNFTDGIDALLANVTIVISIFYSLVSLITLNANLFLINIVMISLLLSFRKYNKYPAKIFMGDTGSLAIGAYVGGMALLLNIQFYLPIFGFIYMIEVISVILQVGYFKMTKGKRLFKMAPIHHHFEKNGYSEKKIVKIFTIYTIVLCILTFVMLLF